MTDAWEARLRAEAQIRAILGKASRSEFPAERDSFMEGAQRLAAKHGIDLTTIKPDAPQSKDAKLAAARRNSASFMGAFRKGYTGNDDTDYAALEKERKRKIEERRAAEKGGFDWGDGEEGY